MYLMVAMRNVECVMSTAGAGSTLSIPHCRHDA